MKEEHSRYNGYRCNNSELKKISLGHMFKTDVARIKIIARKLDSSSFIIITNSREVVGLGFKKS